MATKERKLCCHESVFAVALPTEIEELERSKEVSQLCLFYLDLQAEVTRLQVHSTCVALQICTDTFAENK